MISVVIPLYNKDKQIVKTLYSVLKQTYPNFEVIVVNDGSTDNSLSEVSKISDSRIRLICQENKGVSAARNRGIQEAKSDYIAFLDADDEWQVDYLQTQMNLIKKYPSCSVWATSYIYRTPDGKENEPIIKNLRFKGMDGILDNYFEVASVSNPPLCSISVLIRKSALLEIGGFPVGIASGEDLLTWLKLALRTKIAYSRKTVAVYNIRFSHGIASKPMKKVSKEDPVGAILKDILKQYGDTAGLSAYISRWHEMRASGAMKNTQRLIAFKESILALRYNLKNVKVLAFMILSLLPESLKFRILKFKAK